MGWVGLVRRDEKDDKGVEFLVEWRITYSARRAVVFLDWRLELDKRRGGLVG